MRTILLRPAFVHCVRGRRTRGPPSRRREMIARGKALTEAGDCASCHTADPAKPFAGGKRIDTPFGAIYSPNLTPDRETGLGAWSDEDFYRALRFGVAPDGSRYYPAFPYPNFTKLTRQDIFADPRLSGDAGAGPQQAPPPELRWPLNYRVVMRGWNSLFFKPGILMPDQQKSAEWNRGRYLVEGLGHCGACHTPKNMFGADKRGQRFGGGEVDGRFAPRLDARRAQRAEILERGRHRRISAERPQRQEPCRRADGGGRGQFDLEDERCRCPRHRGLPEGPAGGPPEPEGPPPTGGDEGGQEALRPHLHRLPRSRRIGRAADLSAAARQRQSAIGRPPRARCASSSTARRP